VHLSLLDYKATERREFTRDGLRWHSMGWTPAAVITYARHARMLATELRVDWIFGFSDIWYGVLAERVARGVGARSLIDAYDNYESYISWALPLHWLWRSSLRKATRVSAAGPFLGSLLSRGRSEAAAIVPMAADPPFAPGLDARDARRRLGLPQGTPLVGFTGALHPSRDVDVLFEAYRRLRRARPEVRLVLSGRRHRGIRLPADAVWLGYVEDDRVPMLLHALDVLAVVNRDSRFGNYSHPIKLYEAMRCGLPIVATETPTTRWILLGREDLLVPAGNAQALSEAIATRLDMQDTPPAGPSDWLQSALSLERALREVG
jgi:glycosyltransferase involved in cell wall biosynthesis